MKRAPGGGRKPKPTNLHLLHGNPSKKNLDEQLKNEATPDVNIPEAPHFLKKDALKEWHYITPKLKSLGLMTDIDRAALAAYCICYARWASAETALVKMGGAVYRIKQRDGVTGKMKAINLWGIHSDSGQLLGGSRSSTLAFCPLPRSTATRPDSSSRFKPR